MHPAPRSFCASGPLRGTITVPGDKSISHRALMFSALAVGESVIEGLLEGEDVLATAAALRAMGATIEKRGDTWHVWGVGVGGLLQPKQALDMGNSGTSTRLLMGLVSSHPITCTFTGDASLSGRPMGRVIDPLSTMGAEFTASPGAKGTKTLPLMVRGICPAIPIEYRLPVASAQVKSAILLAGLNTPGITRVIERERTRDHTETMLSAFGWGVDIESTADGRVITLQGEAELTPQNLSVPGDPSSAAFLMAAASIIPGSDVTIENVGINITRIGFIRLLRAMGGDVEFLNERWVGGEPVADIRVKHAALTAVEAPSALAPSMIDEYPILFVVAALANGKTVARGIGEMRVKESDRIAVMAKALTAVGARVEELPDGLIVEGTGGELLAGSATIATHLDHRIAMSMAVAGLASRAPVTLDDASPVATSYPAFFEQIASLQEPQA